jgi:hypothetical protein
MNENFKWIAAAVAVVGLSIGGIVYFSQREKAAPADEPIAAAPDLPAVPEEPAVQHPLPAAENQEALPSLEDSDPTVRNALEMLVGKVPVEQFLVSENLVRHIVVTVDNLPNELVAMRMRPVKPVPGGFAVGGPEDAPVLSPSNYERYVPLVKTFQSVDVKPLVESYVRHYPLFQEAYASLGHPPQYFNDRLIEVIDHLLETPELEDPIALAQPGVQYEYADPEVEARSAGQKALIRMGAANAKQVKEKLRELRRELVAQRPLAN